VSATQKHNFKPCQDAILSFKNNKNICQLVVEKFKNEGVCVSIKQITKDKKNE